jgi:PAS domain S-box-containing protein
MLKERNEALLQQEQAARLKAEDSAQQLRFMAEAMPQKIFTILPNGKTEYLNPQWEEYSGKSVSSDWAKIVHPQDLKENTELWKRSLETGEPFQFEHRLKHTNGTYVWHLTRATALRNKAGEISLWVGSSTDIESIRKTKKLEADTARLIKQRQQLMELNKAKDEFISLASHQLRTPATGVKQYINMVLDGYGGPISAKVRRLLTTAEASNERQLLVINDLLQVAQVDAGKVVLHKERINLDELLSSIIRDQQSTFAKRDQKVRYHHKRHKVEVYADPTKIRMAIENVIDNSSKYSYAKTTVNVRLTSTRKEVSIAIQDEGVGIEKADLEKVFQKFTRLDNELSTVVGGNGLGLYWVKKIIELHGGTITVTSTVGTGTTFTIKLVVAAE